MTKATLRKGSRGESVKELQTLLGGLTVDGIFGDKTLAAVKAYQSSQGLVVDGVVGIRTWSALLNESSPEEAQGVFKKPVDYKQYDSRWATKMYSNHGDKKQTMKSSACGPTATADIVATLIDNNVTPVTLAEKALKWGDRSYENGTNWSFFPHIRDEYSFSNYVKTTSLTTVESFLRMGGYVVASMSKGYWTNGGHYICVWKVADGYVYANDPASSTRTRQKSDAFKKECKAFFCFIK